MGMTIRIDDMIIAVAYFSIPLQLVASLTYYPRLMQMPLKILFVVILFALFVWCCGFGHFLRAAGYTNKAVFEVVNWITAVVSLLTAIVFLPMVPTVMSELDAGLSRLQKIDEEFAQANAESKLALKQAVKDTNSNAKKTNNSKRVAATSSKADAASASTKKTPGATAAPRSSVATATTARTSVTRTSTVSTAHTEQSDIGMGCSSGRRSTGRPSPFSSSSPSNTNKNNKNHEYQHIPTTVTSSSSSSTFDNPTTTNTNIILNLNEDSEGDMETVSWV